MTCIKGFENYIIFEDGMIINFWTGLEIKTWIVQDGYYQTKLSKNGKPKHFYLHRLLGEAFIPNTENKPFIDHIDRNRTNNELSNLQWVTKLENNQNKGDMKNNTSGNKNIHWVKCRNNWRFYKSINGKHYTKHSKDIQELLDYKAQFLLEHNLKD